MQSLAPGWSHPMAGRWWAEFQPFCNLRVMAGAKLNISPYVECSSCKAITYCVGSSYWEEQDQQLEGSYHPLLLGTGEIAPGIVVQFWVPHPVQKGCGGVWRGSSSWLQRQGACGLWGETGGAQHIQSAMEETKARSDCSLQLHQGQLQRWQSRLLSW